MSDQLGKPFTRGFGERVLVDTEQNGTCASIRKASFSLTISCGASNEILLSLSIKMKFQAPPALLCNRERQPMLTATPAFRLTLVWQVNGTVWKDDSVQEPKRRGKGFSVGKRVQEACLVQLLDKQAQKMLRKYSDSTLPQARSLPVSSSLYNALRVNQEPRKSLSARR